MKLKITYLFILLIGSTNLMFGQTMINDFENGTAEDALTNVGGGITAEIVDNPNASGDNTTAKVLKIGRNATQWWIFAGIDVADIAISDSETKFLSFMVYGPKTDLAVRFNATADDNNGTNGGIIRPATLHSGEAQWEQIVIPIVDSQTATSFTGSTLFKLVFHPDIADATIVEGGQILNDSDSFLYIDQIQILDSNPLSISNFELNNTISLSPNPASNIFKVNTLNNTIIKEISIYNILGKKVNALNIGVNQFDISSLSTGMYMVKIKDSKGSIASKKLFVK
ncbi:T9SS type A sorting domain-containing protein [Polaribacter tangerinus]|uniref:T9SS type A sorting domain-containing protein n=1 Tax=Polaribacter tangerinus TaxID=1920034 RepID=UPI000B4AD175|nr:T9SS type A sorting domain-containing protein [Polaribacter tangerinus]